jgi:hypothetical protein
MDYSYLLPYCTTVKQREMVEALNSGRKIGDIVKELYGQATNGHRAFRSLKAAAARQGMSPEHDMTRAVPDGYHLKGASTLYDAEGKQKLQWVKTDIDRERQMELMREAIDALSQELPVIDTIKREKAAPQDLMAIYPLGDPHIGMLSWGEETGQDWDMKIAETAFCTVFDRLVATAPPCKEAVIVNLGDYLHADNFEGVTSRSKHSLDVDGRFGKMVSVAVKIMRQMIESALKRHEKVRVINAIGNHDDTGAVWLSVCLHHMYANNPRLTVETKPAPFHYFSFGNSLFGVHHTHTCKPAQLPAVMASMVPEQWGAARFRTWLTGHIHHDVVREYSGCTVESFRTLAAKDAYASWHGYNAHQDMKCLVISKEHGEVERHTINISQIQGILNACQS